MWEYLKDIAKICVGIFKRYCKNMCKDKTNIQKIF